MPSKRAIARLLPLLAVLLTMSWVTAAQAAAVVEFIEPRLNLREGQEQDITVIRSGTTAGEVTVLLNVSLGGTARLGTDFDVELPLGVIRIPDGQLFGRARLTALQNNRVDGTRYAVLTLANPAGATLGPGASLLLQIQDDETGTGRLEIAGDAVQRVSAGSGLEVLVRRSGLQDTTVRATLLGVPGTAAPGVDFSDLVLELEFPPDREREQATLSTLARTDPVGPRTLSLMLASPEPQGRAVFDGLGPLVIIEDRSVDRAGEFSIFASTSEVGEGDGSVTLTVDRNRGSTGEASVSWVTVDGRDSNAAVAGTDYVASTGTLVFPEGETRRTFTVALVDGQSSRGSRSFQVALANPSALAGLDPERQAVTITIRADGDGDDCRGFCDCFIATAAFGSWMDPHVVTLREFRDRVLMTNSPGRAFVAAYYRASPPVAAWIGQREWSRAIARTALAPVVFAVEQPLGAAVLALLMLLAVLNLRRARGRRG
jgi:hypothetical protein